MDKKELTQLSDEDLLLTAKRFKPTPITDALLIGFLIGIIIYGTVANAWGFTVLIPLFLIYLFLKKTKQYKALQKELKARNLQ